MGAYEEKQEVGKESEEEKKDTVPQLSFYEGMTEEERLNKMNEMADSVARLSKDLSQKDTQSIKDKFLNKNSSDPGHHHSTESVDMDFGDLDDVGLTSLAQGDVVYRGASAWNNLAPNTAGKFLQTQGAAANPVWADIPDTESIKISLTADEAITIDDAVALVPAEAYNATDSHDETNYNSYSTGCGAGAGNEMLAQTFQVSANTSLYSVQLYLKKEASPTDNYTLQLLDSIGNELDSATIDASTVDASIGFIEFVFSQATILIAGTTYYLALTRDGGNDGTNYLAWGEDRTTLSPAHDADYANGQMLIGANFAGLATFGTSPYSDAIFKLYTGSTSAAARIRKANGTSEVLTYNFIGFATEAISEDASGTIQIHGIYDGLTGLSPGIEYYVSDTPGAIATSAGTFGHRVGIASTATAVEIIPMKIDSAGGIDILKVDWVQVFINTSQTDAVGKTYTLPAGTLGANDGLEIELSFSGNAADADTVTVQFGGQTIWELDPGAAEKYIKIRIFNRNSVSAQKYVAESHTITSDSNMAASECKSDVLTVNTAAAVVIQALFDTGASGQYYVHGWTIKHIKA